ncbi:MAG: exonuclease domain-containing protein [Caldilineaceae bacterium]|nr:exonuclease domain-containing protein [Caldilineaceae bacterium]
MPEEEDEMRRVGAFLDTETTGLKGHDEIIEFALVLFRYDISRRKLRVIDRYHGLREPSCAIDPGAEAVHGISFDKVRGKRLKDRVVRRILGKADFLIAHNAVFDRRFVEKLYPETKGIRWYCSMNGIRWKEKGFASKGLQQLMADHGIETERGHRALDDVMGALELLAQRDEKKGRPYLSELLGVESDEVEQTKQGRLGRSLKITGILIVALILLSVCGALFGLS